MPQDRFNLNVRAALLAAIASAYPVIGYSAPAAQVDFAVGNVTAVGANGQSRALGKGAQIEQGDTVNTNGGRAQLRFTDGAYVSLQPESQFRIDQYRFDGKQDGNEKGLFSLLKGGLRTITGLVGRSNKANYQVTTSVATIGIRGTEYTIQYGQSITGTVGEGEINVCNGAGCLNVTNGESYYVQNQDIKPILTNKRTDLPPPEPTQPPSNFVSAENRNPDGSLTALSPNSVVFVNPLVGTVSGLHVAFSSSSPNQDAIGMVQATVNASGAMSSFVIGASSLSAEDNSVTPGTVTLGAPVSGGGNDGIIAWGVALGGAQHDVDSSICCLSAGEAFHYVLGFPTPDADLQNLAINNMVGTYSFLGATAPTSFGIVVGSVTGGSLTASFGLGSLDVNFDMLINRNSSGALLSSPVSVSVFGSGSMNPNGSGAALFSGSLSASPPSSCECSSASGSFDGFFAGTKAARAGLTYSLNNLQPDNNGTFFSVVNGAVTFKQTGLSPALAAAATVKQSGFSPALR